MDLLIDLVHKINTRADRRVEKELIEDRRVRGKEGILFQLAEAAVDHPDDIVREALYPVVGEKTLRELVKVAKANEQVFQQRVRTVLRSSYSNHYRRMLPALLAALDFRCNNTAYRPVMVSLELLQTLCEHRRQGPVLRQERPGAAGRCGAESVGEAVVDERGRIERIPYELCVLVALRDAIRRRAIYVEGGNRWRNPEDDLPGDFETAREVHYAALRQPLDSTAFIDDLRQRMTTALETFDRALAAGTTGGVRITRRHGDPWITVPKLDKLPELENLSLIKNEVVRRWGTIDLLDVLKEADFLTDFSMEFVSVASREVIDRDTLRRRLLLVLFAMGTNMGIKAIVNTGKHEEHEETEATLRLCAGTSSPATTCAAR
ncbi:Tn3 family transposase [Nocardia gipuzkoensis]